jgi:hypothetical protein
MMAAVITVERYRLRTRRGETWAYDYVVDGHLYQYGPGLADLRGVLRRRWPDREVEYRW